MTHNRTMASQFSSPDHGAILRFALNNADPWTYVRQAIKSFDASDTVARTSRINILHTVDNVDIANAAVRSARMSIESFDPATALSHALSILNSRSVAENALRTMSFDAGTSALERITRGSPPGSSPLGKNFPGFDSAVRDSLRSLSDIVGTSTSMPEGEIEYLELPDSALELDDEHQALVASEVEKHQSGNWSEATKKTAIWLAYFFFVLCLIQSTTPNIHADDPSGLTDIVAENWPPAATVPDWLVDIFILAYAITSAVPKRGSKIDHD